MRTFDDYGSVFYRLPDATAIITGSEKYPDIYGRVMLYTVTSGVLVRADIIGLPRGKNACERPVYAFHIHNGTECTGDSTDPFLNAGTHFDTNECPHPYHAGDMPPLFEANGKAFLSFLTARFTVDEVLGKAIIIHKNPDDFTTQPSGNAGEKIACGIISHRYKSLT